MLTPSNKLTFLVAMCLSALGYLALNVLAINSEFDRTDGSMHAAFGGLVLMSFILPLIALYVYRLLNLAKLPARLFFWSGDHPNWDLLHSTVCALIVANIVWDGVIYRLLFGGMHFVIVPTVALIYLSLSMRAGLLNNLSAGNEVSKSNGVSVQRIFFSTFCGFLIAGMARYIYLNVNFGTYPQLKTTCDGIALGMTFFSLWCFLNAGLMYCKRRGINDWWASTAYLLGPFCLVIIAFQKPGRQAERMSAEVSSD